MKPWPSSPMRERCGTHTSSKNTCAVSDDHMPTFLILFIVMPGRSLPFSRSGRQINDLLRCGSSPPVLASRHIHSACKPLVIHILEPLITSSSPSLGAVVFTEPTSEPAPASETPRHTT